MEIFGKAVAGNLIASLLTFGPLLVTWRSSLWRLAALATGLVLLDTACVYLPALLGARGLTWAWCGKALELAVFATLAQRLSREGSTGLDAGLAPPTGLWLPAAVFVGLVSVGVTVLLGGGDDSHAPTAAFLAYEALMPGPAEEVVYRGVLLAVLDARLGRPLRLLGVNWGLGAVLTTVIFFLAHTLGFDKGWTLRFDYRPALDFAFFGLAMVWLRYRFASVWPAALAHNLGNVLPALL